MALQPTTYVVDYNSKNSIAGIQAGPHLAGMGTLGERTKQRREQLGMSQAKLASLIGASQQALGSLESNRTRSFRKLNELAEALQVSPAWLATGKGVKGTHAATGDDDPRAAQLEFAERVREARQANRFTLSAAARGIMGEDDWRLMEAGGYWPDALQLDLICGRLAQPLDWLVRGIVIAHGERPMQGVERVTIHEQPALLRPPRRDAES